ncbi:MAG: FAD-binding protein [Novosphingobium sp.]|nr:FAD-binding protein [Novosphingobium sp.]
MAVHRPTDAEGARDCIADAVGSGIRLDIRGGGSKAAIGAARAAADVLDLSALRGVVDYDPAELVLTARAGTPLAEIEALVAAEGQMLAFEPFDHGPLLGGEAGRATIGGILAAGVAGSRRVTAGGARDHFLGFTAVSGRGEIFVAGGKVVKNVTGYDLPKLLAGSWGRLAAMTEVTIKVLPRPRVSVTLAAEGLDCAGARAMMACALGSRADVSAAAHIPARAGRPALTVLRVAGFAPSVEARYALLPGLLRDHAPLARLEDAEASRVWHAAATGSALSGEVLWRLHLPPSRTPDATAALDAMGCEWSLDWGGGLIWTATGDAGEEAARKVRAVAADAGGQAMLVRAPEALRALVPVQHPRDPAVAALEARVRRAFDPAGVFETGRFLGETHHAD